ncbi:MAG: acetylglutamate kinase [Ginsengibacter sp.]
MRENMFYGAGPIIFQRAEELRNKMTAAEKIIWDLIHINEWHLKFRRQHPISNYIADFYCHAIKLVIEIDGNIHEDEEVKQMDGTREQCLKDLGLSILRFKNEEVFKAPKKVLETIGKTINHLQRQSLERDTSLGIDTFVTKPNKDHSPSENVSNSPLGDGGKSLYLIKIGGNIIDNEKKLSSFLSAFASIEGEKILVHGGGKLATEIASQLGLEQQLINGRRITDAATLKVVTMVYAGYINKNIVAQLQSNNCNAIGLSGPDGNLIQSHKRQHPTIDYGFVGDVDEVNTALLKSLLDQGISLIIAPITHNKEGQLLNTNADTIAQEIAKALSAIYDVTLIYSFEKKGVLENADDENTVIKQIDKDTYKDLKQKNAIFAGMIPKLDNAFIALSNGVKKVIIGKAEDIHQLIKGEAGTTIINR